MPSPSHPYRFTSIELRNLDAQVMLLLNKIDPLRTSLSDFSRTSHQESTILTPQFFFFADVQIARYYAQILAGTLYTRALSMNIDIGEVRRVLQRHLREGFYGEVVESGSEEEKAGEDAGNKKSGEMKENGGMTGENGENGENGDRVKGGEEVKEDGSERKGVVEARKGNGDKIVGVKRGKGGRFQSAKRNWGGLEKEFLKQMIDSLDARIVLGGL